MISRLLKNGLEHLRSIGEAIFFLGDVMSLIFRGRVRWNGVLNQMYEQGVQSIVIVMLTSLATGTVLGLQGFITLQRFGPAHQREKRVFLPLRINWLVLNLTDKYYLGELVTVTDFGIEMHLRIIT